VSKGARETAGVEKFQFCMRQGCGHKSLMNAMLDRINASDLASDISDTKAEKGNTIVVDLN
jgi:hypothetical protein